MTADTVACFICVIVRRQSVCLSFNEENNVTSLQLHIVYVALCVSDKEKLERIENLVITDRKLQLLNFMFFVVDGFPVPFSLFFCCLCLLFFQTLTLFLLTLR